MIEKEFYIGSNVCVVRDTKKSLYGLADKNDNLITPIKYNKYNVLSSKEVCFFEDQKCGVLDLNGNIIVPFLYDCIAKSEKSNIFFGRLNNKYGIINIKNNKKSDIIYDDIDIFKGSEIIKVKKNEKYGLLNSELELVLPIIFDDIVQSFVNIVFTVFLNKEASKIVFSETENKIIISKEDKRKLIKNIIG